MCVCLCIDHTGVLCKTGWNDRDAVVLGWLLLVQGNMFRWGQHGTNPFAAFRQDGDAAFCQITLDTCFDTIMRFSSLCCLRLYLAFWRQMYLFEFNLTRRRICYIHFPRWRQIPISQYMVVWWCNGMRASDLRWRGHGYDTGIRRSVHIGTTQRNRTCSELELTSVQWSSFSFSWVTATWTDLNDSDELFTPTCPCHRAVDGQWTVTLCGGEAVARPQF